MQGTYICPITKLPLRPVEDGLVREDGFLYPWLRGTEVGIPNFLGGFTPGEAGQQSLAMYDHAAAADVYRNFLDWLLATFGEEPHAFRRGLVSRLGVGSGARVLVTGCGLGDDLGAVRDLVGDVGELYANDLSAELIIAAARNPVVIEAKASLAVCDAHTLPFPDGFFDAAFHFGGINLFDDVKRAIAEMGRVVRVGGRVVFGDEGVAPWLKETEYGRIAITNNRLWAASAPLALLPFNALDVQLSWVLGNCFYVIGFDVSAEGPYINLDVPHKGWRGGSMRTRYYGQLEGVSEELRRFVIEDAARSGISVHAWLEKVIASERDSRR